MATYYVRPDGNNANAGTGYAAANAFQTIAKVLSVVTADDIWRCAPGTYMETLTLATSGAAGQPITGWADKEAYYFLDLKPGPVRITGCDVNGIAQAVVPIINGNAKTYNTFRGFVIDGTKSGAYDACNNFGTGTIFNDCLISSGSRYAIDGSVIANTILNRCFINGPAYRCTLNSCLVQANTNAVNACSGYNTTSSGGNCGFFNCSTLKNCTAKVSNIGFNIVANGENLVAIDCVTGFSGSSANSLFKKCKSVNCGSVVGGSSATNKLNISDIKYTQCSQLYALAANVIGTPIESTLEGYCDVSKLFKITNALKPCIAEKSWSTDLHAYTASGMTNTPLTPSISGVTGAAIAANDYYMEEGTYNGALFYVNSARTHVIFLSAVLQAGRYVVTAGTAANEAAANYGHCATLAGTYTNVGTWAGTTVAVSITTTCNQDFEAAGIYNGQTWYKSVFKNYVLFYSATVRPNEWVITAGIQVNEAPTNYCYQANIINASYTKVGTYAGTIANAAYVPITFTENYDVLGQPRRMGSGVLDCGAYEYSTVTLEWTDFYLNAPAIKIARKGCERLMKAVKKGVTYNISTRVKFALDGGATKPKLFITEINGRENVLPADITVTATGVESDFTDVGNLLVATFTPDADGLIGIEFHNQETGINAYAIFSDVTFK